MEKEHMTLVVFPETVTDGTTIPLGPGTTGFAAKDMGESEKPKVDELDKVSTLRFPPPPLPAQF
jgi:hypothetical protein